MSDANLERQIFADAGAPEPEIAPEAVDENVSRSIRDLQRSPDDTPPGSQPAARQPATPQTPDPLAGLDDRSNAGLLRALLDERERRQGLSQEVQRYQLREREASATRDRPALNERLFTDPEGTLSELRQEWTTPLQQQIAELQINHDFGLASVRHGETFGEAWNAWYEQVRDGKDPTTYFTVMNAASPGEAMVEWHRRSRVYTETGGDLDGYRQKVIDEYLAGQGGGAPEPAARAPNGQFAARPPAPQPRAAPTSLSRMGAPARDAEDDASDGSDAAIFAAARPKRRGDR